MNHPILVISLCIYFGVNFLCALALHLHAEHQAHLRLRVPEVLVHFTLLTAFGLPAVLLMLGSALFGSNAERSLALKADMAHAGARAA